MSFWSKEISKFKKRKNTFTKIFPKYKEFINLIDFIDSFFTTKQKQILEFKYNEITIDFKTQLLLCFEDRYDSGFSLEELKEKSKKVLQKYFFLFETNLDFSQIRTILLRELMEVISIGSQCFHHRRLSITKFLLNKNRSMNLSENYFDISWLAKFMRKELIEKYTNLPSRTEKIHKKIFEFQFFQEFFWKDYGLYFDRSIHTKEEWKQDFFNKTKWFFEQLHDCPEEYRNKYREKIYKEVCNSIYAEQNCSHIFFPLMRILGARQSFLFPLQYKIINYKKHINSNLQEIVKEIFKYFGESEIENLKKIDLQGETWSFKEQLLDRYCSKYPSFVSLQEIKKIIAKYESSSLTREVFLDELEQELFISKYSHDWNKEMIGNLCFIKNENFFKKVSWQIKQILKAINYESIESLFFEIESKKYDLKTLLIARWKRSWLIIGKNEFKKRLLIAFIKNGLEKEITPAKLQNLFKELDSCFVFPKLGIIKKFLLRKDGTGDISKLRKNIWTAYLDLRKIKIISIFLLFLKLIILISCLTVSTVYIISKQK